MSQEFAVVKRHRGFTVLEATIVSSLLAGLMVITTMYFVRGRRYLAETQTYAAAQLNSDLLLEKMTRDLSRASERYFDCDASGQAVWFLSYSPSTDAQPLLEFDDGSGQIRWKKWVCYYSDSASKTVYRAEQDLATADSALLVSPSPQPSLQLFTTSASVRRQPVAQNIETFVVARSTTGVVVSVSTSLEAPLTETNLADRVVKVSAATEFTLLN